MPFEGKSMLRLWGWALLKFLSLAMRSFCSLIFPLAPHWLVSFRVFPGTWLLACAVGCGRVTWLRRLDHGTNRTLALIAGETLRSSWCRLVARPHKTCRLVVPCQKIRFIPVPTLDVLHVADNNVSLHAAVYFLLMVSCFLVVTFLVVSYPLVLQCLHVM